MISETGKHLIRGQRIVFGKRDPVNKRIILFLTNPERILSAYDTTDMPEVLMRHILESVKKVKDAHLIIKLHPYDENYPLYRELFRELKVEDNITVVK